MDPLLKDWLSELRAAPISFDVAPGSGGAENLWWVATPPERHDIGEEQLLEFLKEAQRIRLAQAAALHVSPVVFYAWHDEMAGQIRFSVARGTAQDLPFRARVERVSELEGIVRAYLASGFRAGIPCEALQSVPYAADEPKPDQHLVRVWAISVS